MNLPIFFLNCAVSDAEAHWLCYYLQGNLILTDHTYKILIVLRKRVDEASDAHLEQDARYPIDAARKDDAALLEPAALQARCCEQVAALAKATNDKVLKLEPRKRSNLPN